MHAYKDAIRRTGGAYVLYPGEGKDDPFKGFHEIIPGLGAFAIKPKKEDNGTAELKDFIYKIIDHFNNMGSQQRRSSNKVYEIHKNGLSKPINESMPEYVLPEETSVIIGYYKSDKHLAWIQNRMKYNGRIGNVKGSMLLKPEFIGADYLILHNRYHADLIIYKIDQTEKNKPTVVSATDPIFTGGLPKYPNPTQPFYLVFNLKEKEPDFLMGNYGIKSLNGYSDDTDALPFTCKLSDLFG